MTNWAVINAAKPAEEEIDEYVDYRNGIGEPFEKRATSWHSLAACNSSQFFVYGKPGWQGVFKYDKVIVLVERDLKNVLPLLKKLKLKAKVGLAYHEGLQSFTHDINNILGLANLAKEADFYLTIFPSYKEFFESFLDIPVYSCYHAYPYDEWDLSDIKVPYNEKEGVLIGTRSIKQQLLRNTIISLLTASNNFDRVTYLNEDGWIIHDFFSKMMMTNASILNNVHVIDGPLSYEEWLKLIAKHKWVYHHDMSCNFGQIAGDCALVDTVCAGSTTELNKVMKTNHDDLRFSFMFGATEKSYNGYLELIKKKTSYKALNKKLSKIFDDL